MLQSVAIHIVSFIHSAILRAMDKHPYHVEKLLSGLIDRKRKNASFSLRAYARYLGVEAPSLALVLKNKRNLPEKTARHLVQKLALSPVEEKLFLNSVQAKRKIGKTDSTPMAEQHTLLTEESHFRVIAEWEHYAILSLMDLENVHSTPTWVAKRLGISEERAERCLKNLENVKLLSMNNENQWKKNLKSVGTSEDISSKALRISHIDTLELAKQKLDSTEVSLRDFSSITFILNPSILPELKKRIRKFRKEIALLSETKDATEVFQLSLQLFPLSEPIKKRENQ